MGYDKHEPQTEKNFLTRIQQIEQSDKKQRKLSAELYPVAEMLYKSPMDAVPIFNWLADVEVKEHTREDKKYIQLIFPIEKIQWRFIEWLNDNGVGGAVNRVFSAQGTFVTRPNGEAWTYPRSTRNITPESKARVQAAIDGFRSGHVL